MENIEDYKREIEIQKKIAYSAGLLQGDITVKTLLESLAEGVVIINEAGRIVLINNRFSQLTGYTKPEVMGERLSIFLPDNAKNRHDHHIEDFFSHPQVRPMGTGMDLVAKRKDNSEFPVEISLSFLQTETDKLGIAFITDITSRKKAKDELILRNTELDAYAHTVAHDLNSPLSGIIGLSEILLDFGKEVDEETKKEFLEKIVEGGRSMSNVIKEMLVFATLKKEDVVQTKVEMKILIENVIKRLRFQLNQKEVELTINENIPDCLGYGPWVEEIWFNYISNAIKYGGSPLKIEIGGENTDSGFVKYFVKDNGPGISEDLKATVFQDNNNINKSMIGFGLGLPIVKSITEKLDGYLSIESGKGKGSTFYFSLKTN